MITTITITLSDGVRIVVPNSLNLITPYVLLEQQDWFEDEIKFLRRLLQPGQSVIDIGANYGTYTLSMAHSVGPTGQVWAFEPASATADLLAQSIAANAFSQIVLEQSALSSASGTAQLSLNDNSELNALVHVAQTSSATETVPLVTLDECLDKYDWRDVAFMKIDAEGEEANILKGGKRFFAERSPLVQYEIKAGADLHLDLVQNFADLGYASYRLVPGLDLLVPFDPKSSTPDGFLLNLFCCKPDRLQALVAQGFLLDATPPAPAAIQARAEKNTAYHWRQALAQLPYGAQLANTWEKTVATGNSTEVLEALACYAMSRDSTLSASERFAALEISFSQLKSLCERQPTYLRLASLARVARDYGARANAVAALGQLGNTIFEQNRVDPTEPFLAPGERFDRVPPGKAVGDWVLAATLEEFERLEHYSSFYTGIGAKQRLEIIRDIGLGSAEMSRRLQLLQQRFGLPVA